MLTIYLTLLKVKQYSNIFMAAVITGDIIGSSKLALEGRQQRINQLLQALFAALAETWGQKTNIRTEVVQGDAFQVYLADDREAIRATLFIKCFCLSQDKVGSNYRFDCRLSTATGSVSYLHPEALAKSGGLAFDYSGRGLKDISRTNPQLVFASSASPWASAMSMGLAFADELLSHGTPAQNRAVLLKLSFLYQTQDWLATQLGIGRSAYSQRLKQAGWPALEGLLNYYDETLKAQT